jgi:hypothetical protein
MSVSTRSYLTDSHLLTRKQHSTQSYLWLSGVLAFALVFHLRCLRASIQLIFPPFLWAKVDLRAETSKMLRRE